MPISFGWYNDEKTIIVVKMGVTFTPYELINALHGVRVAAETVNHDIDLIVDQRDLRHLPPGLLSTIRTEIRKLPAKKLVQVGAPPLMQALRKLIDHMPGMQDKLPLSADTIEEAVALIAEKNGGEK